jgi:pimeloyl-ACP methyl ester carboxylesterase
MLVLLSTAAVASAAPVITEGKKSLPLPGEAFQVDGHDAFVILPPGAKADIPWVWYAPTLSGLPAKSEVWMFEQFLAKGIAIAGIDVGESYGSPTGRGIYNDFYAHLVEKRHFGKKPCLLARSRGGLMLYSWATENPGSVGGVAGIYPVCNIASYPGIGRAAGAYGLTPEGLKAELDKHNPIDRLQKLAEAKVPILHIHGDKDGTVPLEANSAELGKRYAAFGGPVEIDVIEGQGHNMWNGWFQSQKLTDFAIACALGKESGKAEPEIKAGQKVTLSGKLQGGMMAIGGETTGWILAYRKGGKVERIEVDISAIKEPKAFDGKEVTITGTIATKQYIERGAVLILKAASVTK